MTSARSALKGRGLASLLAFAVTTLVATLPVRTDSRDPSGVTVHEWGTFTSIARPDGRAARWLPQGGPTDVPCFVERLRFNTKAQLAGTVRMETPVVYLYAPDETHVSVTVRFRQGVVTEWFPKAFVSPAIIGTTTLRNGDVESRIVWKDVRVVPRATPEYPTEDGSSHYYAARQTDASPLQVGSAKEKFLFYRGVGFFAPPLEATVAADGRVQVSNPSGAALGDIVLFENRDGAIAFRIGRATAATLTLEPPVRGGTLAGLRQELERILVSAGLYPKEARAMIDTWRDSWFEEGTRLFYLAPRKAVDAILPLDVTPAPAAVARVFVGRMELVTGRTLREVRQAIADNDGPVLRKYGRFFEAISTRLYDESTPEERAVMDRQMKRVHSGKAVQSAECTGQSAKS